jgi:hypothetical protein
LPNQFSNFSEPASEKVLAAYYFLAGMYTLNPASIRAELDEMQDWGTDIVCIAVTSLTVDRAPRNVNFIVEECHKRSMRCFVVPSRIAGITAGAPIIPSPFAQLNPETWIRDQSGKTPQRKVGPICSFYHPKVFDYFIDLSSQMLNLWDLDGFIWDEPKSTYWQDYSEQALANNPDGNFKKYMEDHTDFFSRINACIKAEKPNCTIVYFDEAVRPDAVVETSAKMNHLDYFGTDGKPWPRNASPLGMDSERSKKVVPKYGERFFTEARKNGLQTMCLPENHNMTKADNDRMEQYLPGILKLDIDMWVYYYYPRNQEEPERNMAIIRKNIENFKT